VIQLETADASDDGLWAVLRQSAADAAVCDYLTGLEHFRQREDDLARRSFVVCLAKQPPFLNAAAYYLYLSLDAPEAAEHAMVQLQGLCRDGDIRAVVQEIERQLDARLSIGQRRSLRRCRRRLDGESDKLHDEPASTAACLQPAAADAGVAADAGATPRSDSVEPPALKAATVPAVSASSSPPVAGTEAAGLADPSAAPAGHERSDASPSEAAGDVPGDLPAASGGKTYGR
jgi:hypothetical protein